MTARVTAHAKAITVFLEAKSERTLNCYFDDITVIPYPLPLALDAPPERPRKPRRECVDWHEDVQAHDEKEPYIKSGFTFTAAAENILHISRLPLRLTT